ncbi:MAG TPA: amino acid transporter [Marmoricola sp.]|nr:amino acid transporter [Marmoricola sp.]
MPTSVTGAAAARERSSFTRWFFGTSAESNKTHRTHAWWMVVCLTGVDLFSSLGYAPGIAQQAAGEAAPIATGVLVVVMILGALPVYRRVAKESPHGQGSIAMLERLLPFWRGKFFVLALLGFAATDFVITITLSAADAAAHLVQNPIFSPYIGGQNMAVTLVLITILGGVFLKGFAEAIGIAVALTVTYLLLNAIVIVRGFIEAAHHPQKIDHWSALMHAQHGSSPHVLLYALIVFPALALGMSGFETGVAVMPLVKGDAKDTEKTPTGRIRNTRRLLASAAVIMSVYLLGSALVCSWLIDPKEFDNGGQANGRALAYLAHLYLGNGFGTVYDISSAAILWFAGASAMAGLLNLVPRYLPRYGMAPQWAGATRPLVVVITGVSFLITWIFNASAEAQGNAYATGVLVLITSAAIAVALAALRVRQMYWFVGFIVVAVVFMYTTGTNIHDRPDGLYIALCFIGTIVALSLLSRLARSFELRITHVEFDEAARRYVRDAARRGIRLVAHEPELGAAEAYRAKVHQIMKDNDVPNVSDLIFIEVKLGDPSDFEAKLEVHGEIRYELYRVLSVKAPSVPNALAAILLNIRDKTGVLPHIYFEWTEGNPALNFARFLLFGAGEVAPVTREVLRRAEPDRDKRPHLHVG